MATAVKAPPVYPRPRVAFQLEALFQEPVYADGPYDQGDEEDDLEDSASITP